MNKWGHNTWIFFHCLAEKLKENSTHLIPEILNYYKMICACLPCPLCREQATRLLKTYKLYKQITTKEALKRFVYEFHNIVNKKTNKQQQPKEILDNYASHDLYNDFVNWNKTFRINNYNMKASIDKINIKNVKQDIYRFLVKHNQHFT